MDRTQIKGICREISDYRVELNEMRDDMSRECAKLIGIQQNVFA